MTDAKLKGAAAKKTRTAVDGAPLPPGVSPHDPQRTNVRDDDLMRLPS